MTNRLQIGTSVGVRGRAFLVTGGGSGLGAATVRALEEAGADVAVADLEGEGARRIFETDVTYEASVRGAIRLDGATPPDVTRR